MSAKLLVTAAALLFTANIASAAYLYVELPAGFTPEDVRSKNPQAKEAIRRAVLDALARKRPSNISYVAIITYQGTAITPDADELLKKARGKYEDGPSGEICYIEGYGWELHLDWWKQAEHHIYYVHGGGAYGWLKTFYGDPFFEIYVTVNYDPSIAPYADGMYIPATNEILIAGWGHDKWKVVLTHEMAHSFRDDWIAIWDHFEEGMVEGAVHGVQNLFYDEEDNYLELWHHGRSLLGYPVVQFYEFFINHNMPGLSCRMQDFSASFCDNFVYYRYAVAGMAWRKVYLQERFFLKDFNAELYDWHSWHLPWQNPDFCEMRDMAIEAYYGGPIEGRTFSEWIDAQPIFQGAPLGAEMLLVLKYDGLNGLGVETYLFERFNYGGFEAEAPLAGELVGIDVINSRYFL